MIDIIARAYKQVLDRSMNEQTTDKIRKFFSQYPLLCYTSGQILLFHGDIPEYVFMLVDGRVKMSDVSYRGDEVIIHMFHAPIFFPMGMVINHKKSSYLFRADSDVAVYKAPARAVDEFVKQNADVAYTLLSRVYEGTDVLLDRIAHLMSSNAKSRLMFEILTACMYYGETIGNQCSIKLRERELAARTGLTRETISREIRKLSNRELITYKGSIITILDLENFKTAVSPNLYT